MQFKSIILSTLSASTALAQTQNGITPPKGVAPSTPANIASNSAASASLTVPQNITIPVADALNNPAVNGSIPREIVNLNKAPCSGSAAADRQYTLDHYHYVYSQKTSNPTCPTGPALGKPERQLLATWWRNTCNAPCRAKGTKAGDTVIMNYNLTFPGKPGIIDTTYDAAHPNGQPFNFTLGAKPRLQVIPGFDGSLYGMCKGERRSIKVTGAGGYGVRGAPPDIPGCAELLFSVELVGYVRNGTMV